MMSNDAFGQDVGDFYTAFVDALHAMHLKDFR